RGAKRRAWASNRVWRRSKNTRRNNDLARQSRNQNSEYLAQRRKGREEKSHCHFDRREKSFSDPSHSLGMTCLARHLAFLASWRENRARVNGFLLLRERSGNDVRKVVVSDFDLFVHRCRSEFSRYCAGERPGGVDRESQKRRRGGLVHKCRSAGFQSDGGGFSKRLSVHPNIGYSGRIGSADQQDTERSQGAKRFVRRAEYQR